MYNPETLAILSTQDTGKRQIKKPQHKKLSRWATRAQPKTRGWTLVFAKEGCAVSYKTSNVLLTEPSQVTFLWLVIEERKHDFAKIRYLSMQKWGIFEDGAMLKDYHQ